MISETDPVLIMYAALAKACRSCGTWPYGELTRTDPAYPEWKAICDGLLESARAWFRGTKCRDLPTIARQISLAHSRRWAAEQEVGLTVEHIANVHEHGWYPAVLALLQAEAERVAAERARAAEQKRAA